MCNEHNMKDKIEKLNKIHSECLDKIAKILGKHVCENKKILNSKIDENQLVYYNLAYHSATSKISNHFANYSLNPELSSNNLETNMALLFAGESLSNLRNELASRHSEYALDDDDMNRLFSTEYNHLIQEALCYKRYNEVADEALAGNFGSLSLGSEHSLIRESFRQFADEVVSPKAEKVHANDSLVPEEVLNGLAEMGAFGVTIPGQYNGCLDDYGNIGMMLITEELSRGGLAFAGSLITRPEILTKALLKGGTDEQKSKWLPKLASGEILNAVAVTEPDYGSDVAGVKVSAEKTEAGWLINGVKTWCTFAGFADLLMVLVRTEKDHSLRHKGLSIILIEKPRFDGHKFEFTQEGTGGKMSGSSIPTIGYRGMHSFEVSFEDFFVPDENLIGGEQGRGKGFYLQMAGFAGGRVQTAARANGVMQVAMEAACRYASERRVFGKEIKEYQLSKWKIARMAIIVQASRQYSLYVASLIDEGKGVKESTFIKFYASRISEWVTRESMQLHGGMGYAEEYAVSRYFVDARVFSIFEGTEEVMALRVCAKDVLEQALFGAK